MTGDDAHIDADTASAYAGHALTDDQRAQVEEHIDACAACRELVSTLAKVAWSQTPISGSKVVAVDPAAILPPGTRVGPFEIERPLDAGGMGLVYSATDARLDRRVALKCVREARGDSEQLMREARVMAQLAHPNVVPVYDVVEAFGQVFIAMELVVGRSLRQWLGEQPRGWASVVDAFLEAGAGLAAAHAAGIVHGDVKPANILVGDDGRIRVTDFGLATSAGEAASEQQGLRGTPAYVAPEQRRGQPCDARSDEYSFCVSLHEALYGTLPGKQPSSGVRVPRGVQRVLARGLMEDPAARFGSMKRLLVALRAARSSRRWFVAAVVLLAAAVVMAYDVGGRRAELDQCAAVANELSSVWNAQARQTVRASFERTRLSYAAQTLAGVEANLDAWTTAFDALRRRACETDWLRRETPLERLGAQMRCLTQANREARALVTQLSDADETVVLHSVAASEQLPSLERCAQGPVVAVVKGADEKASNELRDALAHASALFDSGRYDAALKEVTALMPRMPGPADPELTARCRRCSGARRPGRLTTSTRAPSCSRRFNWPRARRPIASPLRRGLR